MTREQLLVEIGKFNVPSETGMDNEAQMRWFVAYQMARELVELGVKDFCPYD